MAEEEKPKIEASLPEDGEGSASGVGNADSGESRINAKKIILFVMLPLFIIIGAGAGLYFSGALDKMMAAGEKSSHEKADSDKSGEHEGEAVAGGAYFLPMPDIIVNLSTQGGQPRYLRLRVQLEMESQSDLEAVKAVMPRVVDQFQTYLRELREKDLRGSAGIYRLQIELLARVNAAAYPVEVKDVLFQEILIQ
jgi:flagellar FliL protein